MNVDPKPHLLLALCQQSLSNKVALTEWIDNALDVGATQVSIEFGRLGKNIYVSVSDNGPGVADMRPFAVLGDHVKHRSTKSGRYGIGSKDAALHFGGENSRCTVTSVHKGTFRQLNINWGAMVASGSWEIDDPTERDWQPSDPPGTKIVVTPVIRRIPEGSKWSELLDDLGYIYTPAIKRGVQITVQSKAKGSVPQPLKRWTLPDLAPGHVDAEICVSGKKARVYAGIVRDGVRNDRPGLTYLHGFRVIEAACANGCGSYPATRIAGFVEVDGSWPLNKNKDGIQFADALYSAVEEAIRDVLKRAESAGMTMKSAALSKAVEGMLNAALDDADAKAKRGKGRKKGTVAPSGKGGRHKRAREDQDGATFVRQRYGEVRVDWESRGRPDEFGRLIGNTVALNLDNPLVSMAKREDNILAATFAAATVLSAEACMGSLQLKLPHIDDAEASRRFSRTLGALLSKPTFVNGQQVGDAAA